MKASLFILLIIFLKLPLISSIGIIPYGKVIFDSYENTHHNEKVINEKYNDLRNNYDETELREIEFIKKEIKKIIEEINIDKIKPYIDNIISQARKNTSERRSINIYATKVKEIISFVQIHLEKMKNLQNEYESIFYKLISNKYLYFIQKQKTNNIEQISIDKMNATCIELGQLEQKLSQIDIALQEIKKEETEYKENSKKSNFITNTDEEITKNKEFIEEKHEIKNILESKITFLENYLEKILLFNYGIKQKILEAKKNIYKNSITEIKEKFHFYKNKLKFLQQKQLSTETNKLEKEEQELSIKKDKIIQNIELNKHKKIKLKDILEYSKKLEQNLQEFNEKNLLEIFQKIELDIELSNLPIINSSIYNIQTKINIIEGWIYLFNSDTVISKIQNILQKYTSIKNKNIENEIKNELNEYVLKYNTYKELLTKIIDVKFVTSSASNKNLDMINKIKNTINIINKKIEIMTGIQQTLENNSYIVKILKEELKSKTFWVRSEYSISIAKLKNFIPELKFFFKEIKEHLLPQGKKLYHKCVVLYTENIYFFILLIFLFTTWLFLPFICRYLFSITSLLIDRLEKQSYSTRQIKQFLDFLTNQNIIFYFWINSFIFSFLNIPSLKYFFSLFYLLSIFFGIYLTHNLIHYLSENSYFFNQSEKEEIESEFSSGIIQKIKKFAKRMIIYLIIILFFLRLSFSSIIHGSSTEILLAAQFIFVQIQLIIFLKKKYMIAYLSKIYFIKEPVKNLISEYYNTIIVILAAIIIMSNPYVGYGYQVIYILLCTLLTATIIPICNSIFNKIKKQSMFFFFNFDEGEAQNKIKVAKILYIFFTILLYIFIFGAGTMLIIKSWGYSIRFDTIHDLFYQNILPNKNILQNKEGLPYLSAHTILTVILYIIQGFVYSYLISQLFLKKILNQIVIGQTMQNTILILSNYFIVFFFFIIGLCTAGIQNIMLQLGALIFSFSFALKEPVADFISYFIILIQCPIKVGDLIRINKITGGDEADIIGIVRAINSRTTIIRQRNSQTIIVPNSTIITRILYNWTYYKYGFTATEDFVVTIDRSYDPEFIKSLLIKIIEGYPAVIKNPKPLIRCSNITPIGIDFMIRAYISPERAGDQWDIASHIRMLIIKKLDTEKIKFAIPEYKININKKNEDELFTQ